MINDENYPLVTIIGACYNQDKFVVQSLNSIKDQTYPNIQLILWDDCSKDDSQNTIEIWLDNHKVDCLFIKHNENQGICKSLNEAFSFAKGKYIQIVALDDILLPDKIQRHVELLENSAEDIALVFSDAYLMNEESLLYHDQFISRFKSLEIIKSGNFMDELLKGNFIPAMTVLYKTTAIREIGLWDESLHYEDYDFLLRLSSKYDFIFDEKLTVKYRLHSSNFHYTHHSNNIHFIDFWIFIKHIHKTSAHEIIVRILKDAYLSKYKYTRKMSKRYFSVKNPNCFLMCCIYLNLPIYIYLRISGIYKYLNNLIMSYNKSVHF